MSTQKQQQQQTKPVAKEPDWSKILNAAGPYPIEAFTFVREGLTFTAQQIHRSQAAAEPDRHISGQQLCMGLRDFAIQQYGLLAPIVLRHWHVRRTDDFGRIVFAMIAEGLMSKSSDDTLEDFRMVYDFDEAFSRDQLTACMAS
jgi:uncharacterized repeat protein (TIGR04138 family)